MSVSSPSGPRIPKPVHFVCEQDVRAALQSRDKIYIDAKTIVTPAAWDLARCMKCSSGFELRSTPCACHDLSLPFHSEVGCRNWGGPSFPGCQTRWPRASAGCRRRFFLSLSPGRERPPHRDAFHRQVVGANGLLCLHDSGRVRDRLHASVHRWPKRRQSAPASQVLARKH